ncbi:hypothetical protein QJS04_geneDACA025047 [Acorus gramineus]|uniref:adenylate kinase n=1 Tax=Acorus gramineus TaxID=55184 RepID=A0AAV8ZZV4_ACOGR|nr:hypothetical protein QJS04_geneDACA025047 [Acorus gramineus]
MAGITRLAAKAATSSRAAIARRLSPSPIRTFAAAAVDYSDHEWSDEEEETVPARTGPVPDRAGSREWRGVQWVFMGTPGAQKHVYASRLSKLLEVPYISMGGLVRQELSPTSSLYRQIANAVTEGKLVPEDIIFGLLSKRLDEGYRRGESGFILDGIPRTRMQAEILDQIADIDLVVNFKCNEDWFTKNHIGGGICVSCGRSIGACSLRPTCMACTLHTRLQDSINTEDFRKEKLRVYAEQSKDLEDYYRKQKKLLDFQVAGGPGETWQALLAALRLPRIAPLKLSHVLTASPTSR